MELKVKIIPAPRRSRIAYKVGYGGVLELFLPPGITAAAAERAVAENIKQICKVISGTIPGPSYSFTAGEEFPLWGKSLRLKFSSRLKLLDEDSGELIVPAASVGEVQKNIAELYRKKAPELLRRKCRIFGEPFGLIPTSVEAADTVSRWGCCRSSGAISFCWKIMLLPEELADYIVCHELAHLKCFDHSPAFWELVEHLCPGAMEKRKKLRRQPELWPPPETSEKDHLFLSIRI